MKVRNEAADEALKAVVSPSSCQELHATETRTARFHAAGLTLCRRDSGVHTL